MRSKIPCSTSFCRRSASTWRVAPRRAWNSSKRRVRRKASRSTSRVQRSPITDSVRAIEQVWSPMSLQRMCRPYIRNRLRSERELSMGSETERTAAREGAMSNEWRQTACILCSINCGVEVQLDGRRLARIRGDKANPRSEGYTCEKALRLDYYQNSRDRLTSPLRRRPDGGFEPIDWDTAIREIARELVRVRDEHGGES